MIQIDSLELLYQAEPERDEAAFARYFARYIAAHDADRDDTRAAAARSRAERSIGQGGGNWA